MMTPAGALARLRELPVAVRVGAIALVAIAAASGTVVMLAHPARTALFAGALRSKQLSEVENQLAAWNVAFTPGADNVVVDASRRNDLLLRLSLAGVPHTHVRTSDETLADVGVLTPQSVIDAQARSGLSGDIEIALRSVDGVDDAHVIVAPAQSAEFADEHVRPATASVRLRLHPGASLDRDAVAGIRRFVAASVPGLDPSGVTILDDRGVALDGGGSGDDPGTLERSLQSALDAAFGAGVAIVRIHADYTHAESEERDTRRTALGGDPLDRSAKSETYAGAGKTYAKSDEHDDRGSDTHETVVHDDAGAVARLSTAVLVDASRGADLAKVRELAAATVGFDARRGDELSVQAVVFRHALIPKHDAIWLLYGAIVPLLPTLAILGALGLAARAVLPALSEMFRAAVERDAIARA
ncbi:MAG TPA: flagellar M-ring protein FliF C-terminal domain-containing protein, partial [Candidatus Lustribacter sp.]